MLHQIITAVFSLFVSTSDATALMRTARDTRLTVETAKQHVAAARFAAVVTDTDPDLLLAIGHHESRYETAAVTAEAGGKISCGVMTPEPTYDEERCAEATRSLLVGYLHGAEHLRGWIAATRGDVHAALLGYAGGGRLIRFCDDTAAHDDHRGCRFPRDIQERARRIRSARASRTGVIRDPGRT